MLIKAMVIFLLAMVAIGMIGNALFPGVMGRTTRRRMAGAKPAPCKKCGRHIIGTKGCDCAKG